MKRIHFTWESNKFKLDLAHSFERSCGADHAARNFIRNSVFYHSLILVVLSSLFCVSTKQTANAQSSDAPPKAAASPFEVYRHYLKTGDPVYPPPNTNTNTSTASSSVTNQPDSIGQPSVSELTAPPPSLQVPKTFNNDIGASADFSFGQGHVTLPVGFALASQFPQGGLNSSVISADRSTVYYGGTVSYSHGKAWYFDFSFEHGSSTGNQSIEIPNTAGPGSFPANFNITDDLYQFYVRYNFQEFLKGSPFKAYLRGGVSYIPATLTVTDTEPTPLYNQNDNTTDILGNFGFGLTYTPISRGRLRIGLQFEGEGFYGRRSQDITEELPGNIQPVTASATIDNNLYGGIARCTAHGEFRLGQSGRMKLTTDIGFQYKYTLVTYSGASSQDEVLYGPYAKVGFSYLF
jgi:hypothetical protein